MMTMNADEAEEYAAEMERAAIREMGEENYRHMLAAQEADFERETAVQEGRAMDIVGCYICHLEQTGKPDFSERAIHSPLRGVQRTRTVMERFDPTTAYELVPCGHVVI
jgi:hypothetical protein